MDLEAATRHLMKLQTHYPIGRVSEASGSWISVTGLEKIGCLGDRVVILAENNRINGEVIKVDESSHTVMPDSAVDGIGIGDAVKLVPKPEFSPDTSWIGRIVDPDGQPLDGRPLLGGAQPRALRPAPISPHQRRPMGDRIETKFAVFDTLLPIVRGQRIGLFAGSGVGKSTLLGDFARTLDADVIVIGLVGERGREVRHFVNEVLGPEGLSRAIVVAATSDRAPQTRRQCAWSATAVAEYFRDQGQHVLLLMDSVTRFAEAHRELAAAAGETTALRGFPATTSAAIAAMCERAGPGTVEQGDITAIYSVLVAGSDMEEPVADMLRGVLDGHVVLDRAIAEGGRFPAVDVLRSVSRSLPSAATETENRAISEARALLGVYERAEMMVQAGLYVAGSDPATDAAIAVHSALEHFLAVRNAGSVGASFALLRKALDTAKQHPS